MSASPLLTICIPSYNRGARVAGLVRFLLDNVIAQTGTEVELVVSNNASTDGTMEWLAPFVGRGLRLINREVFLPTVEEHLFNCVADCSGRYVWFLGDDEVVVLESVFAYLDVLRTTGAGILVSNSGVIDNDGALVTTQMMSMNAACLSFPGGELPKAAGFCFVLSGISSLIIRRDLLSREAGMRWLQVEHIYSHVAWILEGIAKTEALVLNRPLVYYRVAEESHQFGRLRAAAIKNGIGDFHCWGFGLARLLAELVCRRVLEPATVARVFEARKDGSRFRMLDEMVIQMFRQAACAIKSGDARNRVTMAAFEEAKSFILSIDLFMYDLLEPIETLIRLEASSLSGRAKKKQLKREERCYQILFARHQLNNEYLSLFVCHHQGFEIYRTPKALVAVTRDELVSRPGVLHTLDPREDVPWLLTSPDLERLRERIDAMGGAPSRTHQERSLQAQEDLASASLLTLSPILLFNYYLMKVVKRMRRKIRNTPTLSNQSRTSESGALRVMAREWIRDLKGR